ncbi:MAG: recombinase family protein [Deltaproteobacteria bacterium]|nr:recombinase family protein [Deltaproteobacteria bacterium]
MKAALYLRVSTDKQELENQLLPLKKFAKGRGLKVVNVYRDMATGKNSNRPALNKMLKDAHRHAFDVIVVWALDRLSREGMSRTVQLIEMLERMGIGVISYSEPYLDTTNELARNILLAVVSTLAKAERERISERTKAGLARVKRSGKKLGRPPVASKKRTRAVKLLKKGYSIRQVAQQLGVSRSSVFNWRKGL